MNGGKSHQCPLNHISRMRSSQARAQRTYGTTDPGGRLAPRPSEGMLNNPLKVLTPKMTNQPPTTCIVFGTQHAYPTLPRLARSYRLIFAGRRATNHPVQVGSFRVSETGLPCTKDVFLTYGLYPCCKAHADSPISYVH